MLALDAMAVIALLTLAVLFGTALVSGTWAVCKAIYTQKD